MSNKLFFASVLRLLKYETNVPLEKATYGGIFYYHARVYKTGSRSLGVAIRLWFELCQLSFIQPSLVEVSWDQVSRMSRFKEGSRFKHSDDIIFEKSQAVVRQGASIETWMIGLYGANTFWGILNASILGMKTNQFETWFTDWTKLWAGWSTGCDVSVVGWSYFILPF